MNYCEIACSTTFQRPSKISRVILTKLLSKWMIIPRMQFAVVIGLYWCFAWKQKQVGLADRKWLQIIAFIIALKAQRTDNCIITNIHAWSTWFPTNSTLWGNKIAFWVTQHTIHIVSQPFNIPEMPGSTILLCVYDLVISWVWNSIVFPCPKT